MMHDLSGIRVMVVDDDEDVRELLQEALQLSGADVVSAVSARDALALFERTEVDVVVTDIMMPDGDGHWLREQLRRWPRIPVIAVTAGAAARDGDGFAAAGFAGFAPKPLDPFALCGLVARLLGRPSRPFIAGGGPRAAWPPEDLVEVMSWNRTLRLAAARTRRHSRTLTATTREIRHRARDLRYRAAILTLTA